LESRTNVGSMGSVFSLLASGVAVLSAIASGFLWARWLRRRAVAPRLAAWAAYALLAFAALTPAASCAYSIATLLALADESGRGGLGTVSTSLFSGPILLAGAVAFVLAMLVLVGATGRWHWFPRSFVPKNDPPYR
jgi:hypothetical protein